MDFLKIILFSGLIFNFGLLILIVRFVRASKLRQAEMISKRRNQMVEQGKIITAQENLLKSKNELLREKEDLLNEYRKLQ